MKTVLVVDDEPAVRATLRAILEDEGYAVREAPHDGREAYRELRARPDLPDVPVVMMSAAIRPDGVDPTIAAFLQKPFELNHLLALVARLLGQR